MVYIAVRMRMFQEVCVKESEVRTESQETQNVRRKGRWPSRTQRNRRLMAARGGTGIQTRKEHKAAWAPGRSTRIQSEKKSPELVNELCGTFTENVFTRTATVVSKDCISGERINSLAVAHLPVHPNTKS